MRTFSLASRGAPRWSRLTFHADHREARGEASKKACKCPRSAQESRPAGQLVAVALFDFYVEALDFLVERAEWDFEELGGFGLVPVAAFEAVG